MALFGITDFIIAWFFSDGHRLIYAVGSILLVWYLPPIENGTRKRAYCAKKKKFKAFYDDYYQWFGPYQ